MLSVKEVKVLDKEIRSAYDYYVKKSLNTHVAQLNIDIQDNKEFADKIYKRIKDRLSMGVYYLTSDYHNRYCIGTSSVTIYFGDVDTDIVWKRDADMCEKHIKSLKEERDSLLDIIYSRPTAEELSSVYDYILGSKYTIECAK